MMEWKIPWIFSESENFIFDLIRPKLLLSLRYEKQNKFLKHIITLKLMKRSKFNNNFESIFFNQDDKK